MAEIKKIKYFFILLFFITVSFCNLASANIYQTKCKTVEKKNEVKSLSFVFSFERNNIVINKINKDNTKYKIKISKILDQNNFLFIAEDNYFKLEYKPGFSYLKKVNENSNINLVSKKLTGINLNCTKPKLIKAEVLAAELPKNEDFKEVNEKQIKKVLEQLQSGKQLDTSNLNELMSTLQKNNSQTDIDIGQLQGLLQSQNFISQFSKGNLFDKLSSEEFLKMIIEEFKKITKQNP